MKGSGRSIAGLHLRDALDLVAKRWPQLIERSGGHAAAAGVTVPLSAFDRFVEAFESVCRERLGPSDLARVIATDGPLSPQELVLDSAHLLQSEVWSTTMPTRTEVETLNAKISQLRDVVDGAMMEITKLQGENWELKRRLHRRWNGRKHPWRCPRCGGYATLESASLDMNDAILYVQCWCQRCRVMVTPSPGYTVDDIKAALPKGE